uniref:Uncharacterized protein n=1 Tax=Spyridia filamentosa TaxID=196632 RepID=A0A1Z1MJL2_SPYFI|nr:hypothetical protein [Spyridia filamentosa]ARW66136.1 hypothetical protein [Spyridia filamentosa]
MINNKNIIVMQLLFKVIIIYIKPTNIELIYFTYRSLSIYDWIIYYLHQEIFSFYLII